MPFHASVLFMRFIIVANLRETKNVKMKQCMLCNAVIVIAEQLDGVLVMDNRTTNMRK